MSINNIDVLLMIIADQNGGKSNQMRSVFEQHELYDQYNGYPRSNNIRRHYDLRPDASLFIRLSSWHEKGESYNDVLSDLRNGCINLSKRYKVFVPAQVTCTDNLVGGEELFMKICTDFKIRRAFAVWISPDRSDRAPFQINENMASFMAGNPWVTAIAIDGRAAHPSVDPSKNSINSRLLADFLFRS